MATIIDEKLLAMLRCPLTQQVLRVGEGSVVSACNASIAAGRLQDQGQRDVDAPVDGLLVTADGQWAYPVRGTIPTLIPDWAIRIDELVSQENQNR